MQTQTIYKFFLLFLILALVQPCAAQNKEDSLLRLLETEKNERKKVLLLTELTWLYRNKDVDKSISFGLRGLALANNNKFDTLQPKLLNFLGVSYRNRGSYQEALTYFIETEKKAQEVGNFEQVAYALQSIGDINNRQKQHNVAQIYVQRALGVFRQIKDKRGIAYCFFSLGLIHNNKKEYYAATDFFNKSLKIREELKDLAGMAACHSNLGEVAYKQKEYGQAIVFLGKAEKEFEQAQDYRGAALAYYRLAENYLAQNKLTEALTHTHKALEFSEKSGNLEFIKQCYQQLATIYAQQKDFENAYTYQVKFFIYGDSLFNQQKSQQFAELQQKYSKEKDAILIDKLESANKQQQIIVALLLVVLVSLGFAIFLMFRNAKDKKRITMKLESQAKQVQETNFSLTMLNEELSQRNLQVERTNQELKQLTQVQNKLFSIISHDFKNPLISLYGSLIIFESDDFGKEDREIAVVALKNELDQTANLLDNLLHWSLRQMKDNVIKKEVFDFQEIIKNTFDLLQPQASKKQIQLINQIQESLWVEADKEMLTIVFRNLLHNANKYSFENNKIIVFSTQMPDNEQQVMIAVRDFGKGISEKNIERLFGLEHYSSSGTAQEKGSGFGLLLCKDFIEKNGGTIWVKSTEGKGSTFFFSLVSNKTKLNVA